MTEFIQQVWESIEDAPHSELPTAQRRTEFQLVIMTEPPEPAETMPRYPNIPVSPDALDLQRSFIVQPTADNPAANILTEITIGPNGPLVETAKFLAAALPEIVPFAYGSQAELDAAVSKRRRH